MSIADVTAEEAFESLTGYDEIAVEKCFGVSIGTLAESNPITFGRALVFVLKRRDGASDVDAKHAAMDLTIKAVDGYFADESGKGETPPEEQPAS